MQMTANFDLSRKLLPNPIKNTDLDSNNNLPNEPANSCILLALIIDKNIYVHAFTDNREKFMHHSFLLENGWSQKKGHKITEGGGLVLSFQAHILLLLRYEKN